MTKDEILAMSAGRKLDALVAKYVMFPRHSHPVEEVQGWCQCYSTLISAAWNVVEKFPIVLIEYVEIFEGNKSVSVTIPTEDGNGAMQLQMKNLPEAICKCALLAVMEGTDENS